MKIINNAQHRLVLSEFGKQAEGGEPDEESIGGLLMRQPQRTSERGLLYVRQRLEVAERRP